MHDAGAVRLDDEAAMAGARAVLAAADEVLRRRIATLLERGGAVTVASAASAEDLIERCLDEIADVVVVGAGATALSPTGGLALLRMELPDWPVVLVSPRVDRIAIRKAMRAGVRGVVDEATAERTLIVTVRAVLAGQLCVPSDLQSHIARPALSHREKQVLELVAAGLTNQEIGQRLYLAESTVKSHVSSSFRKLGVASRAEAALAVLDPETAQAFGMRTAMDPNDDGLLLTSD